MVTNQFSEYWLHIGSRNQLLKSVLRILVTYRWSESALKISSWNTDYKLIENSNADPPHDTDHARHHTHLINVSWASL